MKNFVKNTTPSCKGRVNCLSEGVEIALGKVHDAPSLKSTYFFETLGAAMRGQIRKKILLDFCFSIEL